MRVETARGVVFMISLEVIQESAPFRHSKDYGQEFVDDNALPDGNDQTTCLLVESLSRPARVQVAHFLFELVVQTDEDGVNRRQSRLFVDSNAITCDVNTEYTYVENLHTYVNQYS